MKYYKTSTCAIQYNNKGAYVNTHNKRIYLSDVMAYKVKEVGFLDCKYLDNLLPIDMVAIYSESAYSGLILTVNNTGEHCKVIPFLGL